MDQSVTVSVLCLTYNHSQFIEQCLFSLINQKTQFSYEILIHDDASDDGTQDILLKFKDKYPNKIQLILCNKINKYEITGFHNILSKFEPKGKYIAFCEGDDYWTDENKLQIQFDFLENHPNYSFCCHRYFIVDNGEIKEELAHDFYKNGENLEINKKLFFKTWVTQPLTCMLRAKYWNEVLHDNKNFNFFRDVHIFYAFLNHGKGISLNRFMGAYRIHDKGLVSKNSTIQNLYISYKIWKELVDKNPNDILLIEQYLSVVRRIMVYSDTSTKLRFYRNHFWLSAKNLKRFIRLHIYLLKKRPLPN